MQMQEWMHEHAISSWTHVPMQERSWCNRVFSSSRVNVFPLKRSPLLTVTLLHSLRRLALQRGLCRVWEVEDHHALLPARTVLLVINTAPIWLY